MLPTVHYIPDDQVDAAMDREFRTLLSTCFTKPQDMVFKERRYFIEPPQHRWFIRDERGVLASQIAVHVKKIEAGGKSYPIGGIAEVSVLPECRGRKYVKAILVPIHEWLQQNGFVFSVLYGSPLIYGSSGYREIGNLFHDAKDADGKPIKQNTPAMALCLTETPWPTGEVYLPGPVF